MHACVHFPLSMMYTYGWLEYVCLLASSVDMDSVPHPLEEDLSRAPLVLVALSRSLIFTQLLLNTCGTLATLHQMIEDVAVGVCQGKAIHARGKVTTKSGLSAAMLAFQSREANIEGFDF